MRMTEKAVVDGREERAYNEDDYPGIVKETTAGRNLNRRSVREREREPCCFQTSFEWHPDVW